MSSDEDASKVKQRRGSVSTGWRAISLKRNAAHTNAKKEMSKAEGFMSADPVREADLYTSRAKLIDYRQRIAAHSSDYQQKFVDEDKLLADITSAESFDEEILDVLSRLDQRLDQLRKQEVNQLQIQAMQNLNQPAVLQGHLAASTSQPDWKAKLPALDIEKFAGDPMQWVPFWDSFKARVDSKTSIPGAEKFTFLKSHLTGEALKMIGGYTPSDATYASAVEALKDRYGDPNLAIFSHMSAMIDMPPVRGYNIDQLTRVRDDCECHIRSLVALGLDESNFEKVFTPLVLSKLPLMVRFELNKEMADEPWSLQKLRELLRKEIRARDMSRRQGDMNKQAKSVDGKSKYPPKEKKSASDGASASMLPAARGSAAQSNSASVKFKKGKPNQNQKPKSKFEITCQYCQGKHFSDQCQDYPNRASRLKRLGGGCQRCLNCMHKTTECKRSSTCRYCQATAHHSSLCEQSSGSASGVNVAVACQDSVDALAAAGSKHVHMQTAVATVRNVEGTKQVQARLLFDTAASRSFVTSRKVQQLEAKVVGNESMSIAGFEQRTRRSRSYQVVEFDVLCRDGSMQRVTARTTDTLTCPISKPVLSVAKYPAAAQMPLAEPCVNGCEMLQVDILIGADHYYDFVTGEIIREPDGLVFLSSRLGYLTSGVSDEPGKQESIVHVVLLASQFGASSEFDLEKFWRIEELGIKSEELRKTSGDEEALFNFQRTVKFDEGRYSISLPWKDSHPELQTHYHLCKGRLRSLMRRLERNKDVLEKYDQTIREQLNKGIIEKAPTQPDGSVHYIPHHEVLTPQKTTTKLRVVYDCSAKLCGNDVSLNDCLHRGPVILEDMCALLMRFRLNSIAIVADIEKAFLQISVQTQDRDVLRFLWLKDIRGEATKHNLVEYRFARVLFGANASPSILGMTVDHHLRLEATLNAIRAAEDMFVDNNVTGVETVRDGAEYYRELKEVFQRASMNLREWFTNSPELKQNFALPDQGVGDVTKVLGIEWDIAKDELSCSGKFGKSISTKRQIVSAVATLFDPCGWFGPVVLPGKLLIREIWLRKCAWDEAVPAELLEQWQKLEVSLAAVNQHRIPRRAALGLSIKEAARQLHCFVDASGQAYAAAIYLRTEKHDRVEVSLLISKSRVSPLKPKMTIPKLELMAATLGSELLEFVRKGLRCDPMDLYLWSDSQCVLHWINANNKATVFVANRVKKIRSMKGVTMRYVPTDVNPADIASRGTDYWKLVDSSIWWHGPEFLLEKPTEWPQWDLPLKPDEVPLDEEPQALEQVVAVVAEESWIDVSRFSRLTRLLRTVAYIKRFVHNSRYPGSKRSGTLTADEIAEARICMDKLALTQLPSLDAGELHRRKQLAVYTDRKGLIRCKSRLAESELAVEAVFPKLMPDSGHYTTLLIKDAHKRAIHGGVAQTLAKLRESYWITRGRTRVKKVVKDCRLCRRISGGVYKAPPMPDIPQFRVSRAVPFERVGLDYMGPLLIKTATSSSKIWICLFTCAVVRAVHLEVVDDVTTSQFLLAFRRFIARFGLPKVVVSDNAKQFKTGVSTMAKVWQDVETSSQIQDFAAESGIRWKFITEKAPWMGGFYERLVGTVKSGLKRALERKRVSLMELQTVVSEVAAMVNDRPLVYQEDEPGQLVLTPSHFINKGGKHQPTEAIDSDDNDDDFLRQPTTSDNLVKEYRRIRKLLSCFWQAWSKEYLVSLRGRPGPRNQRNEVVRIPSIGDVVLLVEEGMPRGTWKIGRIVELHSSQDGQCRSVTVKIPNGNELRRPIKLLVPLEYDDAFIKPSVFDGSDQVSPVLGKDQNTTGVMGRSLPAAVGRARSEDIGVVRVVEDDEYSEEL